MEIKTKYDIGDRVTLDKFRLDIVTGSLPKIGRAHV